MYSGIVGVCVLVCTFVDRSTVCVFWYCRGCVCWCANLSTEAQFVYSGIVGVQILLTEAQFVYSGIVGVCVGVHIC